MTEHEWVTSDDPQRMLGHFSKTSTVAHHKMPSDRKLRLFACACCRQVWDRLTDEARCERCMGTGKVIAEDNCAGRDYKYLAKCPDCSGTGRVNHSRRAVEVAERYADGLATDEEQRKWDRIMAPLSGLSYTSQEWLAHLTVGGTSARGVAEEASRVHTLLYADQAEARRVQAALLREVFGNPFAEDVVGLPCPRCRKRRHCVCHYLTPTVLSLARAAYSERPGRLGDHEQYERFTTSIRTTNSHCLVCGYVATGEKIERNHRRFCTGEGMLDPGALAVLSDALEEAGCEQSVVCPYCGGAGEWEEGEGEDWCRKWCPPCGGAGRMPHPLLEHLRSPGPHVRGCWVLDCVLGKE